MTNTDTPPRPRYMTAADTAKLIRPALKAAFPGVRFSVRSHNYAGGSSIDVDWTDGPTSSAVDAVLRPFSGATFDGMADLKSYHRSWLCPEHGIRIEDEDDDRCCDAAELVHLGADFVFAHRQLSPEFRAELEAQVARVLGQPDYDGGRWIVDDHGYGEWMSVRFHALERETGCSWDVTA